MLDQSPNIKIEAPVQGISRKVGYQSEPPFTTYDSLNFWPIDVHTGRIASATRPPMSAFTSPGGVVNMLERVNGVAANKPLQSMVCASDGQLYWWNGVAWANATGALADNVPTDIPVYGATYLQQVFYTQPGAAPFVFDYPTGAVTTLVASAGVVPLDCRMFAVWQGALWQAGQLDTPHILYGSRVGNAYDWDFAAPIADEGGAFFTGGEKEGLLRGPITAIMPHTTDTMIISTVEGLVAFRGHPRISGVIEDIGGRTVLGQGAWTKGPDDTLYMLTTSGLMSLAPNAGAIPTLVSSDAIPKELIGLLYTYENPTVSMEFDTLWNGLHIVVRGIYPEAWWFDLALGGWHKMSFAGYPYRVVEFPPIISASRSGVLYAGEAYGGLSRLDSRGVEEFSSYINMGPFPISADLQKQSVMQRVALTLLGNRPIPTGTFEVSGGSDAEDAVQRMENDDFQYDITIQNLDNNYGVCYPRIAGAAGVFRFSLDSGHLAFEQAVLSVYPAGLMRIVPRKYTVEDVWPGYVSVTVPAASEELIDFTHLFSFSLIEADEWWNNVQPSGADIRITTELNAVLPSDLIHFDLESKTGIIAFKVTVDDAPETVRFWVGNNVTGPPTNSEQAYDSLWLAFWPDGAGENRLSHLADLLLPNGGSAGGAVGAIEGSYSSYYSAASEQYASVLVSPEISPFPVTLMAWSNVVQPTAASEDYGLMGITRNLPDGTLDYLLSQEIQIEAHSSSGMRAQAVTVDVAGSEDVATSAYVPTTNNIHAAVFAADNSRIIYQNGVAVSNGTAASMAAGQGLLMVGARPTAQLDAAAAQIYMEGSISLVSIHTTARSAEWVERWSDMMNQGAFYDVSDWSEDDGLEPPDEGDLVDTWAGYVEVIADAASATLVDFTHILPLSIIDADTWWEQVQINGADIRISDTSNNNIPFDVIHFDRGLRTGLIAFKSDVDNAGPITVRVWAGNPLADFVVGNLGRAGTYDSSFIGFWPDGAGENRTSGASDMELLSGAIGGSTGPVPGSLKTYYENTAGIATADDPFSSYDCTLQGVLFIEPTFDLAATAILGSCPITEDTDDDFSRSIELGHQALFDGKNRVRSICLDANGAQSGPIVVRDDTLATEDGRLYSLTVSTGGIPTSYMHGIAQASTSWAQQTNQELIIAGTSPTPLYESVSGQNVLTGHLSLLSAHNVLRSAAWVDRWADMLDWAGFYTAGDWTDRPVDEPDPDNPDTPFVFADWEGHVAMSVAAAEGVLSNFTYFLSLDQITVDDWWEAVAVDGGDIRVASTAHVYWPTDVISIDVENRTGLIAFKVPATSTSIVNFNIHAGNEEASLPVYNRDAYDSDWVAFWPTGSGTNRLLGAGALTPTSVVTPDNNVGPFDGVPATRYTSNTGSHALAELNSPLPVNGLSVHAWAVDFPSVYGASDSRYSLVGTSPGGAQPHESSYTLRCQLLKKRVPISGGPSSSFVAARGSMLLGDANGTISGAYTGFAGSDEPSFIGGTSREIGPGDITTQLKAYAFPDTGSPSNVVNKTIELDDQNYVWVGKGPNNTVPATGASGPTSSGTDIAFVGVHSTNRPDAWWFTLSEIFHQDTLFTEGSWAANV